MSESEKNNEVLTELTSKIKAQENFIKESMAINGSVNFDSFIQQKYKEDTLKGMLFECKDSSRGEFYIGWYKKA